MKEQKTLIITRVFNAAPATVWKAWTEEKFIKQWWGPDRFTCPSAKIDLREGGTSVLCMRAPAEFGGEDMYSTWHYTKIIPLKTIQYIDSLSDKEGNKIDPSALGMPDDFPQDTLTVVNFKDLGNNTTEVEIIKYHNMEGQMFEMAKMGWEQSLGKMGRMWE